MQALREACAAVAQRASSVAIAEAAIPGYAARLALGPAAAEADGDAVALTSREQLAAYWFTLDAINFGSGWFPTLRKRPGLSGYGTVSLGLRERALERGPFDADELAQIDAASLAPVLTQDADHPLVKLYAESLRDLGARVKREHGGRFAAVADGAAGSAVALAKRLGAWTCFADCSRYDGLELPFLKRAQIAAADLDRAGVAQFNDIGALTMFADNLVPHVLRLDGLLTFDPQLVRRIEAHELIEHGSREEIEIRACTVHAVELIVAACGDTCAAEVDQLLWRRGGQPRYKAVPRHRSRCTAY